MDPPGGRPAPDDRDAGVVRYLAGDVANAVGGPASDWYVEVIERLFHEFEGRLPLPAIVDTVHTCRGQLDVVCEPDLPELVERLARQRLMRVAESAPGCRGART